MHACEGDQENESGHYSRLHLVKTRKPDPPDIYFKSVKTDTEVVWYSRNVSDFAGDRMILRVQKVIHCGFAPLGSLTPLRQTETTISRS